MTQKESATFVHYGVRLIGVVYLALGVIGFVPIEALNPLHSEGIGAHYLLNLVAINWFHNLFHIAIGITALWAARTLRGAQVWGKIGGSVLLLLFVVGMAQAALQGFPKDQLLLRLVPLNSPGHILHLFTGGLALYLGLAHPAPGAS